MTAPTPATTGERVDDERAEAMDRAIKQNQWKREMKRRWTMMGVDATPPPVADATKRDGFDVAVTKLENAVVLYGRTRMTNIREAADRLAATRADVLAHYNALSAELAAMRERAERAEAYVHDLVGCEWPGCDQPSTAYRTSSDWSGRLCVRHSDRPALFPKESTDDR